MKITAITRYKHGTIYELLQKHGWSQADLARRCEMSQTAIGKIINLQNRPTATEADKIQKAFGEIGDFIDVFSEWPETFSGLKTGFKVVQTEDVDAHLLLDDPEVLKLSAPNQSLRLEMAQALESQLETLTDREKFVLKQRFYEDKTLPEIAKMTKFTQERIRQVEAKALRKLRHPSRLQPMEEVMTAINLEQ